MAETPNHGYNVPDEGTQDWHEPLNQNFEAFEVDIELRDTGGPTEGDNDYDPTDGAKYLDITTGEVYIADGTTWSQEFSFGGGGGISSLTGGDGIDPDSIGDGDTLSVASGDLAGPFLSTDGSNDLTVDAGSGLEDDGSGTLQAALGTALGFDGSNRIALTTDSLTVAGNSVSLGGSTDIGHADLTGVSADQHHPKDHDHTETDIAVVPNTGLANSSVTVTAGNGLGNGGQVSLGGTTTLDVDPSEIAGNALEDDGSDNLAVSAGGIDTSELASGAVTSTEISDGTITTGDLGQSGASDGQVLQWNGGTSSWETAPGSLSVAGNSVSLGGATGIAYTDLSDTGSSFPIPNVDLANSSVTVTAGDGLKNGGSVSLGSSATLDVEPSDIAGNSLEDDGSDNLAVSAGGIGTGELSTPFADLATLFGDPITTGGTIQSSGALTVNTDGANGGSRVLELGVPKKGDMDFFEAGGNVVAGHPNNTVNNEARGVVIGGGGAALSGNGNTAGADWATVSGGDSNTASGENSTVGGGNSNDATGDFATIPGGLECEASGSTSFAAGYRAKATNDNTFVWADSSVSDFSSTGADQFLVEASGGTGIGTNDPVTTFHVQDSVAESGGENLGRHVAAIENTSSSSSPVPDVLGLELTNVTEPNRFNSYISFMHSTGTIGNIQGDGNGGVEFVGSTADFAEFFLKANPEQEFTDGTVVGLDAGEVVALDAESEPDTVLVVSTAPLVTGNRPIDEGERDAYVKLSLVGQVPVRVSASVGHGDVLVADDDGTAIPRPDCAEAGRPVVGMALAEAEAGEEVLALVGGPGIDTTPASGGTSGTAGQDPADGDAGTGARAASVDERDRVDELEAELDKKAERIADLEAENESLRDANEQLRERNGELESRLAAVEDHLGLGDSGTTRGVADD